MASSLKRSRMISNNIAYLFCALLSLFVLLPMWIAVLGGFKSMGQLIANPFGLPSPFEVHQYTDLLVGKVGTFWRSLGNSLFIAVGTVAITLFSCVLAAFALARMRFRLNAMMSGYFMLGLLFPLAVAILPLYLQIRTLGMLDKYIGVILPQVAFQLPMTVLLMRGFFAAVPQDLEDACAIDGYGPVGFLVHMVLPLSTPILATTAVITLVASWNNFFLPLLVFNEPARFTLPMGVMDFQGQHATSWNLILGYLTLAMVPAIILFITAQRYIVAGLTGGAVKG